MRKESIAIKAKEFLKQSAHLGNIRKTDEFVATIEKSTAKIISIWRKKLQNKKYRGVLKLRAGNIA